MRVEINLVKIMKTMKGCQETRGYLEMDATFARAKVNSDFVHIIAFRNQDACIGGTTYRKLNRFSTKV